MEKHYVHKLKYSTQERVVGVFVLAAIAVLIMLLFISGDTLRLFERRVHYIAYMGNAIGVSTKTKIRISGIEVGTVRRISLNSDNRFKVELSVYRDFESLVRTDSRASVSRLAFIGDSVINIKPGSKDQPQLPYGGVLEVDEAMSIDELITNIKPSLERINTSITKLASIMDALPAESLATLMNNAAETSANLQQISRQIAEGHGTMGAVLQERQLYDNLNQTLLSMQQTLDNINQTTVQTRAAAESLPRTLEAFAETAAIVRTETAALPQLTADMRQLLDDVQQVVDALRYTWPISSKIEERPESIPLLPATPSND